MAINKILSFVVMLISIMVLAGCSSKYKSADITICIPAGTTEEFVYIEDFIYSNEEISTNRNVLTLSLDSVGDDIENAEIVLKPIEYEEENTYERTSIIPGTPVKIDVEKGAWFKIGIAIQNNSDEDLLVSVTVNDVMVRMKEEISKSR